MSKLRKDWEKGDSCITHSMFSITKSKNVFSCFSCDFKGGPATLYAHFNNVSYIEACVILAYRLGDITLEQYESINGSTDAIKIPGRYKSIPYDR